MRHGLLAAALCATVLALGAARAEALSCVPPQDVLARAELAFVGTLVAQDGPYLTFRVDEVARGSLPAQVVVRDSLAPPKGVVAPSWAMQISPGRQVGLVVFDVGGELVTDQCSLVPVPDLRAARDAGWPSEGVRVDGVRVRGARALVDLACLWRCEGTLTLRSGGRVLGRRRFTPTHPRETLTVRLAHAAARRIARRGRLAATATVDLGPYGATVTARVLLRRGAR